MKKRMPKYCRDFHCIASRCTDNCCIGWEIDIDEEAAALYAAQEGAFGERLKRHVSWDGVPHFILDPEERCPFLNQEGLCDIYTTLGEAALCQICTDHPRYYEWLGEVCEGGIGLCCEEAARIILSQTEAFSVEETETSGDAEPCGDEVLCNCLFAAREEVLTHLQQQEISLYSRISDVLYYAFALQEYTDHGEYPHWTFAEMERTNASTMQMEQRTDVMRELLGMYTELEQLNAKWQGTLQYAMDHAEVIQSSMPAFHEAYPEVQGYLQNTAVYFIWRYWMKGVWDGEVLSCAKLTAMSVAVLETLYCSQWMQAGELTFSDCVQLTKDYSKEIEYSEENLNALADASYEATCLSLEALCGYFGS